MAIRVTIDPGHAKGSDKHGCNGFSEQAHNLAMAKNLKAKLESAGIAVTLTRDNGVIDAAQDSGCKHVFLSESGFHDNPQDWAAMHTPEGIEAICEAHAIALCDLLDVAYPAVSVAPQEPTTYTVQRGDTLSKIGAKVGISWKALAALNDIRGPLYIIRTGQVLKLK